MHLAECNLDCELKGLRTSRFNVGFGARRPAGTGRQRAIDDFASYVQRKIWVVHRKIICPFRNERRKKKIFLTIQLAQYRLTKFFCSHIPIEM
jgi:hypothetical protein